MAALSFRFSSDAIDGKDFTVLGFTGTEGLSRLYRYEIELKAPASTLFDLDDVLDKSARLVKVLDDGAEYPVHGMLASFDEHHTAQGYTYYSAVLVPHVWKITVCRTNEIYTTEKTVDKILSTVLENAGFSNGFDFDIRGLSGTFLQRDYVCQFRESDFDFICRLMENEGIYFYFQQKPDGETMIIANGAAYSALHGAEAVFDAGSQHAGRDRSVHAWSCRKQRLPQNVTVRDYNPDQPSLDVAGRYDVDKQHGSGTEYLYGDHFADETEAGYLATIRAEEFACRKTRFYGEGSMPEFAPGFTFDLTRHPNPRYDKGRYLLVEVNHEASGLDDATMSENSEGSKYANSFVAMASDLQYRPPLLTAKPRFYGTMTAFVHAEAASDSAELDEHGRYRVHLPFDRAEGAKDSKDPDRKASAWIRMAQPYVGESEGMYFPLRGGTEVLLTFINGDPDRPIISGAVPNAATPSLLTNEKSTESTIRTAGNNKLRMEDREGSERVVFQSPTGGSWIRIGAPNDPIVVKGDNPAIVAPGATYTDEGAGLSDTVGGNTTVYASTTPSVPPGFTPPSSGSNDWVVSNTPGVYRLSYAGTSNGTRETATRTIVVLENTTDDTTATNPTFSDGIRVQTSNNIWMEAKNRYADYRVGVPPANQAAPSTLQYLVDKVIKFEAFAPTNIKPYRYKESPVLGHHANWADDWTSSEQWSRTVLAAQVKLAKGDTIVAQEGNIYDFGGYWNYNLGNRYVENHINRGQGKGDSNTIPEAYLNAKRKHDLLDKGGPDWKEISWPKGCDSSLAIADNSMGMWVEKHFGNSYVYREGDVVTVTAGSSLSVKHPGRHIEVAYDDDGKVSAWKKTEGGDTWEKEWSGGSISRDYFSGDHTLEKKYGPLTGLCSEIKYEKTLADLTTVSLSHAFGNTQELKIATGVLNTSSETYIGMKIENENFLGGKATVNLVGGFTSEMTFAIGGKLEIENTEMTLSFPGLWLEERTNKVDSSKVQLESTLCRLRSGMTDTNSTTFHMLSALITSLG